MGSGTELDLESRKALAKKLYLEDGMDVQKIAKDPRIDRHYSQVYRWRQAGKWDQEKKFQGLQERLAANENIKVEELSDLEGEALVKALMSSLDIEWDSSEPLGEKEFYNVVTVLVKKLLESALTAVVAGNVQYTNPYQVQGLLELILKEMHIAKGEPTDITEHRTVQVLPEDDEKAIREGMRRMKMIAERRKNRPLLHEDGDDDSGSGSE